MPQSPANAEQAVVAVAYASGDQMKLHELAAMPVRLAELGLVRIQPQPQAVT